MSTPPLPLDEEITALRLARTSIARHDASDIRINEAHRKINQFSKALPIIFEKLEAQERKKSEGQSDWLTCHDPRQAVGILSDTSKWLDDCGRWHGLEPKACWPWHPQAVALLLAAERHYRAAYSQDATRAVLDLLTQYIPTVKTRVSRILDDHCNVIEHSMGEGGAVYAYDVTQVDAMAIWWATDRTGLAPGLRPTITATA